MSFGSTYYDLLRINPGCTSAQLTRAFRKMALVYGSEGNPNLREKKFEAILEAYHVLSDPEKRAAYDRKWRGTTTTDPASPRPTSLAVKTAERNRLDIILDMEVSLNELYCGVYKTLVLERNEICDECETTTQNGCLTCGGKGLIWKKKKFNFLIEKGAQEEEEHKIRFEGEGDSEPGSEPGDLIVVVKMRKHPVYTWMGITLCANVYLTLAESLCGFQRTLQTLDGRELSISSEPGKVTLNGCIKYLENEGMPLSVGSDRRGKMLLKFHVMAPEKLNRLTVERLAQTLGWEEPPAPEGIRVPLLNAAEDSVLPDIFEMAMKQYETEEDDDDELY